MRGRGPKERDIFVYFIAKRALDFIFRMPSCNPRTTELGWNENIRKYTHATVTEVRLPSDAAETTQFELCVAFIPIDSNTPSSFFPIDNLFPRLSLAIRISINFYHPIRRASHSLSFTHSRLQCRLLLNFRFPVSYLQLLYVPTLRNQSIECGIRKTF